VKRWPLLLILLATKSFAVTDYAAETLVRSYPLAAYLKGAVGESLPLWGSPSATNPLYGFIRLGGIAQTSGAVNSFTGEFQLFPLSILGLYWAPSFVSRAGAELPTFDCAIVVCKDTNFRRQSFGAKAAIKLGAIYWTGDWKLSRLYPGVDDKDFADEQTTLVGTQGGDTSVSTTQVLGLEYSAGNSLGILAQYNRMKDRPSDNTMGMLFTRHEWGNWNFLWGAGAFKTATDSYVGSTLLILRWTGSKGLTLF
jgi:hypothetical protein